MDGSEIPAGNALLSSIDDFSADWAPSSELVSLFCRAADLPRAPEVPRMGAPLLYLYTEIDENELRGLGLRTKAGPGAAAGASMGELVWALPLQGGAKPGIFIGVSPDSGTVSVVWPRPGEGDEELSARARETMARVRPLD
jgi:hypothetical protein